VRHEAQSRYQKKNGFAHKQKLVGCKMPTLTLSAFSSYSLGLGLFGMLPYAIYFIYIVSPNAGCENTPFFYTQAAHAIL